MSSASTYPGKPLASPSYITQRRKGTSRLHEAFEIGARKGWALAFGGPAPVAAFKPGVDRYREACAKYGTKPVVACVRVVYVTDDERRARTECEDAMRKFFAYVSAPMQALRRDPAIKQRLLESNYAFYAGEMVDLLPRLTYDEIVTQDYAFVGIADQVLDQCMALRAAVDIDEILIITHYGDTATSSSGRRSGPRSCSQILVADLHEDAPARREQLTCKE